MRTTIADLHNMKRSGRRIAMVTAYDFPSAKLADRAGIPMLLVGDSLGMVMQGHGSTLPVTLDDMVRHAAGTVLSDSVPRIVEIREIKVDAEFGPSMIYVTNEDKPGFIGALGTILGNAGVNIATFNLGRERAGGDAICVVAVDEAVPDSVLDAVKALPHVVRVRRLEPGQVFEVDTPNLAFSLRQPGEYRIEVDPDGGATTIFVRKGTGERRVGRIAVALDGGLDRGVADRLFASGGAARVADVVAALDDTRKRGFAVSVDTYTAGLSAISAPVRLAGQPALGVLTIAGPTVRFTRERMEALGPELVAFAAQLAAASGSSPFFNQGQRAAADAAGERKPIYAD